MKKRICIFTSTRADYSLLKPLMAETKSDPDLNLLIIASGSHLSAYFGDTINEIEADNFKINEKVDIGLTSDSPVGICASMGIGMAGYGEALNKLMPELVIILGDRYEAFTMAAASTVCRTPVAHIHGGETTEGAIDEAFRHSITKMSHLHFTSTEEYRNRVIQLGEKPHRVFNVGALGIENIRNLELLSLGQFEKKINFSLNRNCILVTFHPVTLENSTSREQFQNLLVAVEKSKGLNIIFTKANADTDGHIINKMIDDFTDNNPGRSIAFKSMGQLNYLSALRHVNAVVGNSSSGIIEAPALSTPTVNIGDRQKGRIKPGSIIDCEPSINSISKAMKKALSEEFKAKCKHIQNPYEKHNTSKNILKILKNTTLKDIIKKGFHNISFVND